MNLCFSNFRDFNYFAARAAVCSATLFFLGCCFTGGGMRWTRIDGLFNLASSDEWSD